MSPTITKLLALLGSALLSASAHAAEGKTVHIYNWIEYLPEEILQAFEAETGIRPVYDVFDSAELLEFKLLSGNSGYDVVFPGSSGIARLIQVGALEPLERSKLSNWQHLDDRFMQQLVISGDPGNQYSVPYMWGTTLIGYNVDKVREALGVDARLDSWELIFRQDTMAKLSSCGVGFIDSASEIFPIALRYLGLAPHSLEASDYQQAKQLMLGIRPYITYFNSSRYGMDLANGDICVGVGWSGGVAQASTLAKAAGNGVKIEMILPREGAPMWIDVMVIPKGTPHIDEAHAFINYILRPEVIAKISNALGYPNANKDATALVDESIRGNPAMYVPDDRLPLLYSLQGLPLAAERLRTRAWSAIRAGK
ncbi:polyamine ABC transporter substrate-binding protein [Pseudomonas paeninsulae]|uniref:polyamine ABC transporter substrate-binding protein n=1 Tax=Pseudomonas paeninsulae TaxID=3110772 RepID=UPI002D77E8BB|nr:polyamine ABC transporter substrate-binding protein [Pseudomonas sp. IT1137]